MKIGVMFGNPETTTGGNALKFYASVRMDIRRIGAIKDGEEVTGNRTKVKIVKNKVAPPFKEVEFDIMYGQGISKMGDLLDTAAAEGIVEKAGAWYSYNNAKLGQGREQSKDFLTQNPEIATEIRQKVFVKHGITKSAEMPVVDMSTGEIKEEKTTSKKDKKVQ
jgi:recombination protein RecA